MEDNELDKISFYELLKKALNVTDEEINEWEKQVNEIDKKKEHKND